MRRIASQVLSVLCLLHVTIPALAQTTVPETPVIVVSGEGVVTAAPDMASLRLGVVSQADTAANALAENNAQMAAVLDLLSAEGIEQRDIQTSDFSVQPVYDRRSNGARPELLGYSVRNMVHIRLRSLDRLGVLLDAVVSEGSNTLQGLSFGLSDSDALEMQAEALAVSDALAHAEGMAAAAGRALGPVLRIEAVAGAAPRPMMEMAARAADAGPVPVASGELSVRAQVRMTILLAE